MTYQIARRFRASLAIGAMGVALVAGLGACSSTATTPGTTGNPGGGSVLGGGKVASTEICAALAAQSGTLEQGLEASLSSLDLSTASADELQTAMTAIKAAFGTISTLFRAEAAQASDSTLAKALTDDAAILDADTAKINSPTDLLTVVQGSDLNFDNLTTACPNVSFGE